MEDLDHFLDERVGSDPGQLQNLLASLTEERDTIRRQVSRVRKPLEEHSQTTRTLARE